VLRRRPKNALDASLALAVAALVLFLLANYYPFLVFKVGGRAEVNRLITGVFALNARGMPELAIVILFCSILAPGLKILLMLYILLPLKLGRTAPGIARTCRWLKTLGPWGMIEVYMVGVIIGMINLAALGSFALGTAFYCFVALFFVSSAASARFDPELVWERLE
jgi:paraquat-inducible protein A